MLFRMSVPIKKLQKENAVKYTRLPFFQYIVLLIQYIVLL